jgi:hypothetical protein
MALGRDGRLCLEVARRQCQAVVHQPGSMQHRPGVNAPHHCPQRPHRRVAAPRPFLCALDLTHLTRSVPSAWHIIAVAAREQAEGQ